MIVAIDAVGIRGHGAANILKSLLNKFSELKPDWQFNVYLYPKHLLEFELDENLTNVKIIYLPAVSNTMKRLLWINRNLTTEIKKLNIDVIFSFANIGSSNPPVPQIVFLHQANIFHTKISITYLLQNLRLYLMRKLVIKGIKASKYVVVQTTEMAENLLFYSKKFKPLIKIIPSGYSEIKNDANISLKIKELIRETTFPRLVYISHPSEHKNHINLIIAFEKILKIYPNASLLLTLNDSSLDNRYRKFVDTIKSLSIKFGIENRIYFLGNINHDEVYYSLEHSDIMVYPSLSESFGLGLVEAMYKQCPIAASDLPYAREVAGSAAVYFNPHDPKSITETITKLISNKDMIHRLKENATKEITKFDYKKIAADLINLMQQAKGV